jgi:hypothetical protein
MLLVYADVAKIAVLQRLHEVLREDSVANERVDGAVERRYLSLGLAMSIWLRSLLVLAAGLALLVGSEARARAAEPGGAALVTPTRCEASEGDAAADAETLRDAAFCASVAAAGATLRSLLELDPRLVPICLYEGASAVAPLPVLPVGPACIEKAPGADGSRLAPPLGPNGGDDRSQATGELADAVLVVVTPPRAVAHARSAARGTPPGPGPRGVVRPVERPPRG